MMKRIVALSLFFVLMASGLVYADVSIKENFFLESQNGQQGKGDLLLVIPKSYYSSLQEQQAIPAPFRLPFTITIDNISGSEINLYHFYRGSGEEESNNITKFIADQNVEPLQASNIEFLAIHGINTLSPPPMEKGKLEFNLEIPLTEEIITRDGENMRVSFMLAKRPFDSKETATVSFLLTQNEYTFDHDIQFDTNGNPQMFYDIFNNNTVMNVYANSADPKRIEKGASSGERNAIPFTKNANQYKIALKIEPIFAEDNTFISPDYKQSEVQYLVYEFTKFNTKADYGTVVQEVEEVAISGSKMLRDILQAIHEQTNRSVNYEDGRGISITLEQGDSIGQFTETVYTVLQEKLQDRKPAIEARTAEYVIRYNRDLGTKDFRISESPELKQKEDLLSRYKLQPDRYPTAIKKLQRELEDLKKDLVEHDGKYYDPSTVKGGSIIYFPVNLG